MFDYSRCTKMARGIVFENAAIYLTQAQDNIVDRLLCVGKCGSTVEQLADATGAIVKGGRCKSIQTNISIIRKKFGNLDLTDANIVFEKPTGRYVLTMGRRG